MRRLPNRPPIRFNLIRHVDHSGVSGTGLVAHGAIFADGTLAVRWITGNARSTGVFDSVADLLTVHGHGGDTELVPLDPTGDLQ